MSLCELIDAMIATGRASLSFGSCGDTKKRNGERHARRPGWSLMVDNAGFGIGKIGARYASACLNGPHGAVEKIEAEGMAKWKKEIELGKAPGMRAGFMGW